MKAKFIALLLSVFFTIQVFATTIEIDTNQGKIMVKLDDAKAPKTVTNFLEYVKKDHYTGSIFHRVIKSFMIQGGGFDKNFKRLNADKTVKNEADNGLKNKRGTIAMARTADPHSASAQFFINTKDNTSLDYKKKSPYGWGYAVFGKVTSGMAVVDKIENLKTGASGPFQQDVPQTSVIINSIKIIK